MKKRLKIDVVKSLERFLYYRPRARALMLFVSVVAMVASGVIFILHPALLGKENAIRYSLEAALGAGGLFLFSITMEAYRRADFWELDSIREKREKLENKIAERKQADVFEIVQLSLAQGTEYYTINKSQARKSFSFSVLAIAVGLVTVVAGIWLVYSRALSTSIGTLSAVSGLLLQFFGGANFYIYNKSLEQMNHFYDRLMQMQDAQVAIKVGDQIQDAVLRDKVKEYIVAQLLSNLQPGLTSSRQPNAHKAGRRKAPASIGTHASPSGRNSTSDTAS